jgi:hypothetical protein
LRRPEQRKRGGKMPVRERGERFHRAESTRGIEIG